MQKIIWITCDGIKILSSYIVDASILLFKWIIDSNKEMVIDFTRSFYSFVVESVRLNVIDSFVMLCGFIVDLVCVAWWVMKSMLQYQWSIVMGHPLSWTTADMLKVVEPIIEHFCNMMIDFIKPIFEKLYQLSMHLKEILSDAASKYILRRLYLLYVEYLMTNIAVSLLKWVVYSIGELLYLIRVIDLFWKTHNITKLNTQHIIVMMTTSYIDSDVNETCDSSVETCDANSDSNVYANVAIGFEIGMYHILLKDNYIYNNIIISSSKLCLSNKYFLDDVYIEDDYNVNNCGDIYLWLRDNNDTKTTNAKIVVKHINSMRIQHKLILMMFSLLVILIIAVFNKTGDRRPV